MSGVWDTNEDRSGDNLFLGINKTLYLMGEDRISMAELVALWNALAAVCVQDSGLCLYGLRLWYLLRRPDKWNMKKVNTVVR